ncbi:uncharacterized protein LOC114252551 isoform X2 [Bombyx mandarina]|uniref:Uncharacterized protein LOC114252551 isoform X2 n=1 Tax=Bombyx mandarina TaxID=7092 RepID=A0A6J2KRU1_BOMMA|nr:uncharacterized protein LOC114252551 isoform X2 [Bombyx mandarina]
MPSLARYIMDKGGVYLLRVIPVNNEGGVMSRVMITSHGIVMDRPLTHRCKTSTDEANINSRRISSRIVDSCKSTIIQNA